MPLSLTDEHPQGLVVPGGEGHVLVLPGGEPGFLQTDRDGIVIPLGCDGCLGGLGQQAEVGLQNGLCLRGAGDPLQQRGGLGQDLVPDVAFEGLVGLAVGVGQHVEADDLVCQLTLGSLRPEGGTHQAGKEEGYNPAPGEGKANGTHRKTPSCFAFANSMDGVFGLYTGIWQEAPWAGRGWVRYTSS